MLTSTGVKILQILENIDDFTLQLYIDYLLFNWQIYVTKISGNCTVNVVCVFMY